MLVHSVSYAEFCLSECRYAEYYFAEYHYAESRSAVCYYAIVVAPINNQEVRKCYTNFRSHLATF